jgi:glycosyltransferase 2 family protein
LWQLWHREPIDFGRVDSGVLAGASLVSAAAVTAHGLVWPMMLRRLGVPAKASWVGLYFMGQLGKYVPGSVWQYAGRIGLARRRGVPTRIALASVLIEIAGSALAAAILAALALPLGWAAVVWAALVVGMLARSRLAGLVHRLAPPAAELRAAPVAVCLYVLVWLGYGVAFWLTARALFAVPASQLVFYVGVFATAWVAGFVVVFAPGGIGVRETVIVALLAGRLGEAHAIALAAASRIVLTCVDLAGGAAALSVPALRRPRQRAVGAAE